MEVFIVVDLGASNGRVIAAGYENEKFVLDAAKETMKHAANSN